MAARLYASGAVATKRAACEAVGLSPNYLTVLDSAGNETIGRIQDETERAIDDQTIGLSKIVAMLSWKALGRVSELMKSPNEHVALKASSDILDRNPETSKTFKASITSFNLDSTDAKELAAALVAGARIKAQYLPIAAGDYVQVEDLADGAQIERPKPSNGTQEPRGVEGQKAPSNSVGASDASKANEGAAEGSRAVEAVMPEFTVEEES